MCAQSVPRLCIVSGPSSAGKSAFIHSPRAAALTGLGPDTRVLGPKRFRVKRALKQDVILHYNLTRPAQRAIKRGVAGGPYTFDRDTRLLEALAMPAERSAVILVVDRETLIERVRRRQVGGPGRREPYDRDFFLNLYERLDLDRLYEAWRGELRRRAIPYLEIDACDEAFALIEGGGDAPSRFSEPALAEA